MQDFLIFFEHHRMLTVALLVVFGLIVLLEFIKQKSGAARLSPLEAINLMNHQNATVIDIRSSDAFLAGHIVGAVSLPLNELEEKYKKIEKCKAQPIIIVCAAGAESPRAAASLIKKGFTVYCLNGGIRAWRAAEMPIVKD